MSHLIIRRLLETRLSAWAKTKPLQVAYQNVKFTPPASGIYLRAFTIPAVTDSTDLPGKNRQYIGLFQVSIVIPADAGTGTGEQLIGELATLFPLFDTLSQGDLKVKIMTPIDQGPELQGDTDYTVPTSFRYRADTG
jgi:hypothetical protein